MPTITTLPSPPSTSDPINFSSKADSHILALQTFTTEVNAFGASLAGAGIITPSRDTVAVNATTTDLWNNSIIQDWTGTATVTNLPTAPSSGSQRIVYPAAGTVITDNANISVQGSANYTVAAGDELTIIAITTTTFYVKIQRKDGTAVTSTPAPAVRQTVLSGTLDTSGLPSFGGSTGSSTVTTSTTLTATASNGTVNRIGSITNPSWTGLSTNGTMYLYLDIDSSGVCTTGSTTLSPNYRWGGADVTTSGQFTFNIQEMVGKVGNGATATQTYRVFVGEVTVAGSVVTAITWYALMGRYFSPDQSIPANGTAIIVTHNLGVNTPYLSVNSFIKNTTSEGSYIGGDMLPTSLIDNSTNAMATSVARLSAQVNGNYTAIGFANKSTAARFAITTANWRFVFNVKRDW